MRMGQPHYILRRLHRIGPGSRHNNMRKSLAHFLITVQMRQRKTSMDRHHFVWRRGVDLRKLHVFFPRMVPMLVPTRIWIELHFWGCMSEGTLSSYVVTDKSWS